jgi:endonuclease/exonuclease/phosphatase (EEP) superfamily protein YafD
LITLLLGGLTLAWLLFRGAFPQMWADHLASAHSQVLLALLLLAVVPAALLPRWWLRPGPPLMVIAFWLIELWMLPAAPVASEGAPGALRLLSLNAQGDAQNADCVLALIDTIDPDVVCLQEASGDKTDLGERLLDAYPHQLKSQPGFRWFTMLLSKHPLDIVDKAPRRVMARYEEGSLQSAVVHAPGGSLLIGTCHLIRGHEHEAIWEAGNRAANEVSDHLAETARARGVPALLAGDLNGGPLAQRGRNVYLDGAWRFAQRPWPWHGTWPSRLPSLLRIQLDQVFVTPGLGVASYQVGGSVGSDHLPIIVELTFAGYPPGGKRTQPGVEPREQP